MEISGMGSMCFDWMSGGFGVSCKRCGKKNAEHRLAGDMPPGIAGTYCTDCKNAVCKKASDYYKRRGGQ